MNRKEFIKKFSLLTFGLASIPNLYADNPNKNNLKGLVKDSNGILDLPLGFTYSIISKEGDIMNDGLLVPPSADGMTCLELSKDRVILIRNHEIGHVPILSTFLKNNYYGENYQSYKDKNADKFYDIDNKKTHCFGGTTSIVYNLKTQKKESEYLSLAGTLVNCSGGKTPWNTWISCEETVRKEGEGITKNHGYNFEVFPSLEPSLTHAIPLKDMGRFRHEGIAFDKTNGYVYQTEDRSDGLFYRFIPNVKNKLSKGGKLQVLSFKGFRGVDTSNWKNDNIKVGKRYDVKWIDINNVNSPNDDLRYRGKNKGAATFARGEGIFCSNNIIYFTATTGGEKKCGQIWRYIPYDASNGSIELFYESKNSDVLNMPDNIIISPKGDIILCEDGKGTDRLVCIKSDGSIYYLANNALNNQEFAGLTFSPNGSTLFVNIYSPTMTFAITGPWENL